MIYADCPSRTRSPISGFHISSPHTMIEYPAPVSIVPAGWAVIPQRQESRSIEYLRGYVELAKAIIRKRRMVTLRIARAIVRDALRLATSISSDSITTE